MTVLNSSQKEVHIYMLPEAAAPQTTPQTNGGQVTGFVS